MPVFCLPKVPSFGYAVERAGRTSIHLQRAPGAVMAEFFYRSGPNEYGPLTSTELRKLVQGGRLIAGDEVRKGRHGNWVPAMTIPGLFSQPIRHEELAINEMDVIAEVPAPDPVESVASAESDRETAVDSGGDSGEAVAARARKPVRLSQHDQTDRRDTRLVQCATAIGAVCYFTSLAGLILGLLSLFSEQTLQHQIYTGLCFLFALVGLGSGCALSLLLAIHRGQSTE
jgi:hypothetical protein